MADWLRIGFIDAMTHVVPRALLERLVAEMIDRGHPIEDFEERYGKDYARSLGGNPASIRESNFDCGGAYIQGEPKVEIEVDGLSIEILCAQIDYVAHKFATAEPRRFADGTMYFKLKFWHRATVLTAHQFVRLKNKIMDAVPVAVARAEKFMDEFHERHVELEAQKARAN